jgi:putative tricarboxylic transport membrane protein
MDQISGLVYGFSIALTWQNLFFCLLGTVVGTLVGVLPGLGPAATVALLLPITFKLQPVSAIIMLAGIFYGAMYGGSTTSILLNIPGEAASVVTCIDGYQMARNGRPGPALAIAAIGSFIAGTIGILGLNFLAPPLADFAVRFGPPEYFALTLFGLFLAAYLASTSIVKGCSSMRSASTRSPGSRASASACSRCRRGSISCRWPWASSASPRSSSTRKSR